MIATPRFVYLHLHKSGGTFVNEALLRFVPGARQLGYHLPARLIPHALRKLPVLGFVRNPWAYYVSWYSFQSAREDGGNALFRALSDDGRLNFKQTVRNMLELGSDAPRLDRLLAQLPDAFSNQGFNLPRPALEPLRGLKVGFYTYLYQYMFTGHNGQLFLGRTETLREDLLGFFDTLRLDPGPELRDFISSHSARNASRHGDWRTYYDEELRDLVAERDATVIGQFNYAFSPAPAAAARSA